MPALLLPVAPFRRTRGCAVLAASFAASTAVAGAAAASPSVWVIDDGEKIRADAVDSRFENGADDPVWQPGAPVRLFALRNESVALQVVVEADEQELQGVAVELDALDGAGEAAGARLVNPAAPSRLAHAVGVPIERFVELFATVRRPSASADDALASEGWEAGSGPEPGAWIGRVPDALWPVESAPTWPIYPMRVPPRTNGIVWIDLNVPRDQRAGTYRGAIRVRAAQTSLASIPVELEVASAMLPDRTVAATAGYDDRALRGRLGDSGESQMWQLLHAHRIAPLHDAVAPDDLSRQRSAIDGSLYTAARGYLGPAPTLGDGVVSIGAGGAFGAPDERSIPRIAAIAEAASEMHAFGGGDVFFDVADETCASAWATGWSKLLRESDGEAARRVKLGWTCTRDPSAQSVDVAILHAAWDPQRARAAQGLGKASWVYGGVLPRTGSLLIDDDAVSPRVNGWLQAMFDVPRWLVPRIAEWPEDGPDGAVDAFDATETTSRAGLANGGGVLVYPGLQVGNARERSAGLVGVLPSIRLKNWRRGLEDAGYLQLARDKDRARADAIARWLVPAAFGEAGAGPASWSHRGKAFFDARRALLSVIAGRAPVALPVAATTPAPATVSTGCSQGSHAADAGAGLVVVGLGLAAMRGLRRRPRHPA